MTSIPPSARAPPPTPDSLPESTQPARRALSLATSQSRTSLQGIVSTSPASRAATPSRDLLPPRRLEVSFLPWLEAAQKGPSDFCTVRLREGERLFQDHLGVPSHVGIPPAGEGRWISPEWVPQRNLIGRSGWAFSDSRFSSRHAAHTSTSPDVSDSTLQRLRTSSSAYDPNH